MATSHASRIRNASHGVKRGPRVRRAFTLVEAIVAILVMSVAMPAILTAMSSAQSHRTSAAMASTARWLACEKLEDVIADRHSATRGYSYVAASNYAPESSVSGFAGFSRSVTITLTAADLVSAGTGYKRVVVTVSYTDPKSVARQLSLETVLTEYTP